MLPNWSIFLVSVSYIGLLFLIAYLADRKIGGRSWANNPFVYTLSIAVYCTAWTFYGSVGRAATTGVGFLPIYLGPTLMAALWWLVLRKLIRITRTQSITSIADFIASRYGKSHVLGGLVALIAVVGILPYISLQLKAVTVSFDILRHYPDLGGQGGSYSILDDKAFYIAGLLAVFTILFGTRSIDATERHEGIMVAVAFESLFKLLAFLSVGLFVTFGLFDGPSELFSRALAHPEIGRLLDFNQTNSYTSWFTLTMLSSLAILFLPRQFQVSVVENLDERHVLTAAWALPLYLLLINLFVLPIALGGLLEFPKALDPDAFVLTLPLAEGRMGLAVFAYLGGLSAATGMVIVAVIAIATMVSNHLVMPLIWRLSSRQWAENVDLSGAILNLRRLIIVAVLFMGYLYYRLIGESYALVSIGLVSFVAAAQFAPPILLGIYWKAATKAGALAGLTAGFGLWAYTLLMPALARSGWLPLNLVEQGPWGIDWLRPYQLFGLHSVDPITHAVFWTLLANFGLLLGVSAFTRQSPIERVQAHLFVDVFVRAGRAVGMWQGKVTVEELHGLLSRFLGHNAAQEVIDSYPGRVGGEASDLASPNLIDYAEKRLAGSIGGASARVMIGSIVGGKELSLEGVMDILEETSQVLEYSRQLEQKSNELEQTSKELREANERLKELDRLKDEFVSTVSHELRTPLTSVRAFSEILAENPDAPEEQRQQFLEIIIKESERLTRLINDVLDISKLESGKADWQLEALDLREVLDHAVSATSQLFKEREVRLQINAPSSPCWVKGDRDRLVQLTINLLSNAVKFSDPKQGVVEVSLKRYRDGFRTQVMDNGVGIAEGERERIFERFHQVSDQQAGKPKGTGLGLAITRHIVEAHWGRIWVEQAKGGGANFIFDLPSAGEAFCPLTFEQG